MSEHKSKKPKLLVSTSTFVRHGNDRQPRFVLDFVKALQPHFTIVVLAPSFPGALDVETIGDVEVVRFRYAPFKSLETLAYNGGILSQLQRMPLKLLLVPFFFWGQRRMMSRLLKKQHFDAINAHWSIPQALIASSLPKKLRLPLITTCHGADIYLLYKSPLKALLSFCLRRSDKVLAVSEELREICSQLVGDKIRLEDVGKVPMGVNVAFYARNKEPQTDGPAKKAGDFVVTFVGRLVAKKGVATLIDAMCLLPEQDASGRSVVLWIIGDGILRKSLQNQAEALGLGNRLRFLGWRNDFEKANLLQASDVCVVPSVLGENGDKDGLPVTLLEAAASGTAIIGSNIAGIPDFLIHELNGLLCRPGDANDLAKQLQRLMMDEALREQFARKASVDVRRYDWAAIAQRSAVIINDAIAKGRV